VAFAVATILHSESGTEAGWELLARAYPFLGRTDDAQPARAHVASPAPDLVGGQRSAMRVETLMAAASAAGNATGPTTATLPTAAPAPSPAPPAATLEELRRRVHERPGDAAAWLARAERYRERHDNTAARDALAKVVALHGMTAQSWADYADVLASLAGGSLAGAAGGAIDQALMLDPANPKALWLKASQAHEQHHFAGALGWWHKLRAVLPADAPEARLIDANIAEDTELGGLASGAIVEVSGTVSIDSHLAGRVQPDATLFIYAKAADSPGPPLAVMRTAAAGWPVRFRLNDSMAMLPSRRLSQFDKVVIEARISRSGQATPGSGDLYVTSPAVNPGADHRLALVINRQIN
jgi:cytochrome c-type biogenesis protein CcmH